MKNSKINHKKGGGGGLRKTFYGWEGRYDDFKEW